MISISTILGLSTVAFLIIHAIVTSTDNYFLFFNIPSLFLVLGGTFGATFFSYGVGEVLSALRAILATFLSSKYTQKSLRDDIARFIEWNKLYRKQGISAVENILTRKEKRDPFVAYGIELLSTGYDSKNIHYMLSLMSQNRYNEFKKEINILKSMATFSPAFGLVGTVTGLIIMLDNLEGDVGGLAKGMSIAMIATLYGLLFAQILFKPAATQINQRLFSIMYRDKLLIEGFTMLAQKIETVVMQDRLNSLLNTELRYQSLA